MRVEDLTKFEGECPNIVVFGTYMDIRVPLTKKWKKIINERGDKPNTYHNCLISYISEQIALFGFNMKSIGNLLIKGMILQNRSMMSFMLTSNIIVPALRIKSSGNIFKHTTLCRGICLNK